jgi:hypothetical protein
MPLKLQDIGSLCGYIDTGKSVNFIIKSRQKSVILKKIEEMKGGIE